MKEVNIKIKSEKNFYRKIFIIKIHRFCGKSVNIIYQNKKYNSDSKKFPQELGKVINCLKIINANNKNERLSLIYDYSCEFLDSEYLCKNLCGFKNNMCECNRNKPKEKQTVSCCTHRRTGELCDKFDDISKACTIKSISCKLFACPYLVFKKKIKFTVWNIPYLRYFLSLRQKAIVRTSFFQDKDVVMDKLLKFYKMP